MKSNGNSILSLFENLIKKELNFMTIKQAIQQLKGETFKLWVYFYLKPQPFMLDRKNALAWGIKKDAYYRGIQILEEKGILVKGVEGYELR